MTTNKFNKLQNAKYYIFNTILKDNLLLLSLSSFDRIYVVFKNCKMDFHLSGKDNYQHSSLIKHLK